MKALIIGLMTAGMLSASGAVAENLPSTKLKVVGSFSNLNMSRAVEKPFWTETIPTESGGAVSVDFVTLDQMGLQGTETLRLMRLGVIDFASGNLSYMSADNPAFDAMDLVGLLPTLEIAREAMDAYKPVLDEIMRETYNSRLLMAWPAPPQVIYCKPEINGLSDLAGKKVRVYNKTLSDFVTAIGGTPVTIAWPEVVTAFQRGTIDCGVTGTLSGNTAKWWEVTDYLLPLNLGWAVWFHAVNLDSWNRLDPKVQAFLEQQFAQAEQGFWDSAAVEAQDGINCNTGQGECQFGEKGKMKLVPVEAEDEILLKKLVETVVLPGWAEDCGADCAAKFNDTVGEVIGTTAKVE